ncbi:hypothetical protein [Streptomyces sp. TLI_146]|uniref:hypothetical protein n=1 Tax=Streptomyces sp. TLI_146 TaxID=1938858 RepID=UPI0015D5C4C8|nr:hypothetical protein [Streptomyces sp. TLI_146]
MNNMYVLEMDVHDQVAVAFAVAGAASTTAARAVVMPNALKVPFTFLSPLA